MQLHASPVSAMIVSRSASTSVCLKLRENSKDVFLVLDFVLAPREHGHIRGTTLALVINTSLEQTAARLSGNSPMDNHMMTRDRQWQAQLFTSCAICMFSPAEGIMVSSEAESLAIHESVALLKAMGNIDDRGWDWEIERDGNRDQDRNRQGNQPSGSSGRELGERTPVIGSTATTGSRHASRVDGGFMEGGSSSTRTTELRPKMTFVPYEQTKRHCRIFLPDDDGSSSPMSPTTVSHSSVEMSDEEAFFECVICFDDIPEIEGIRLLPCAHGFCRDCLAGHVCSKIYERRFPVFCPLCMTEQENASPSGER